MGSKKRKSVDNQLLLSNLIQFYDEFARFNNRCSFMCDAVSSIAAVEDAILPETVDGIYQATGVMQRRCNKLKEELKAICEMARSTK